MTIDAAKKIDFIFFDFKKKATHGIGISRDYIWNFLVSKTPELEINKTMYDEIIRKLVEDGYVREELAAGSPPTYHLTFNGLSFKGYEEEVNTQNAEKTRLGNLESENQLFQREGLNNARRMNLLTLILAIGTGIAAVYYILEILHHCWKIYPH